MEKSAESFRTADPTAEGDKAKPKKTSSNRRSTTTTDDNNGTATDGASVNASASKKQDKGVEKSPAVSPGSIDDPASPSSGGSAAEGGANTGGATASGIRSSGEKPGKIVASSSSPEAGGGPTPPGRDTGKANSRWSSADNKSTENETTKEEAAAEVAAATDDVTGDLASEDKNKPKKAKRRGSPVDQVPDKTTAIYEAATASLSDPNEEKEYAPGKAAAKRPSGGIDTDTDAAASMAGAPEQGGETKTSPPSPAATASLTVALPPERPKQKLSEAKQTRFDAKMPGTKSVTSGAASTTGSSKEEQEGSTRHNRAFAERAARTGTAVTEGYGSAMIDRRTMPRKAKTPSSIVEKRAERPVVDFTISHPVGPPSKRLKNPPKKLGRRNSKDRGSTGNESEGEGGEGGGMTPTPPQRGSNPINAVTPPRAGSRGGNLAVSSSRSSVGERTVSRGRGLGGGWGE